MKQIEQQNSKWQRISHATLYCVLVWSIVLCSSCGKDFEDVSGEEEQSVPGWVSILLSEPDDGVTTYAVAVDNKFEYNLQNLTVYMFEETSNNYVLKKIFSDDNQNIEYEKGYYKAQYIRLDVSDCTNGSKRFVIVANVNGTDQMQCQGLEDVQLNSTTLADFQKLTYNIPTGGKCAAFLSSIVKNDRGLPLTASQAGKFYVEISLNVNTGTNVSGVSLERRVARIDIVNDKDTNFTLEKIFLKGIPATTYLCNEEAEIAVVDDYEEEMGLSALIEKGDKYSFYVFPGTIISKNNLEDNTPTIVLQGKREEYFPLKNEWVEKDNVRFCPARSEGSDLPAKANHKYNLNVPAYEGGLDIYLCMGQSNMEGRATPYTTDIIPGAYLFKNKDGEVWEKAANPLNKYSSISPYVGTLSPAYNFAIEMRKYYPNYAVGLVLNAKGGTNLHTQWKAYTGELFLGTQLRMSEVMSTKTGIVRGILWHQGEYDAAEPYRSAYMDNFITFVNAWRNILDNPNLPIVAGEILSSYSDNQKLWNEMFQDAPNRISNMSLVSHEGTASMADGIHFDAPSLLLLGERYADAMKNLRETGTKSIKSYSEGNYRGICLIPLLDTIKIKMR
jgi:hypothetical protein